MSELQELKAMLQEVLLRVDAMDARFDTLEGKVDRNTTLLEEILQSSELMNTKLESMERRVSANEDEITNLSDTALAFSILYNVHSRQIKEIISLKSKLNNNTKKYDNQLTLDDHTKLIDKLMYDVEVLKFTNKQ